MSQAYTGSANLETYFSGCNDVWYVDDGYLDGNADPKKWLRFLKWMGANDTPRILRENVPANDKELSKRDLKGIHGRIRLIKDVYLDGLSKTLAKITDHSERSLSLALWHLLIKVLPSEKNHRDIFFQGICRWHYYTEKSMPFDAAFYCQLKDTAWIPDAQGNFRLPSECFAPTAENRKVLGGSVVYLPPDVDVSQDNETARWLAEKLGIHLNANTESVLNHLQTLSGTKVSVEKIEPLYHFLERQGARRSEEFKQSPLIFTPEPKPRWWRAGEVFWEEESVVFDKDRGYLRTYYPETLKPFFIGLGASERAAPLDYVRGIQEMASVGQAENSDVRKRVNILYGRLWQALQEGGDWQETEEWNRTQEGRCWLGKKGNKWGFFYRSELVWNDHYHIAEIFEGDIPFWGFDDLLELARRLEIEGCSQAKIEFHPEGDQEEDTSWSEKVGKLRPYIQAFLNSPSLCDAQGESKSADILELLSVRLVEGLETTYTLKEKSLADPNPRQSFLDTSGQRTTLWLALEAEENEYAWLIGDALQVYFHVKELSGFIEDLLTKNQETVLTRWRQKGLQFVGSVEEDSKEGEESSAEPDNRTLAETSTADANSITERTSTQFIGKASGHETPTVNEVPERNSGEVNLGTGISETRGHPVRTKRTSQSTGYPKSTSIRRNSVDTHGHRNIPDREGWAEETEISSHAKKEIEHIGMTIARRYEEEQGRTVEDVSAENLGYDLYSTASGDKIRYIEVKARADHALVVLTSNEWNIAKQLNADYFLYVILNASTQPELYIIQNPTDKVKTVPDVRYQVQLAEIKKHGKLVYTDSSTGDAGNQSDEIHVDR